MDGLSSRVWKSQLRNLTSSRPIRKDGVHLQIWVQATTTNPNDKQHNNPFLGLTLHNNPFLGPDQNLPLHSLGEDNNKQLLVPPQLPALTVRLEFSWLLFIVFWLELPVPPVLHLLSVIDVTAKEVIPPTVLVVRRKFNAQTRGSDLLLCIFTLVSKFHFSRESDAHVAVLSLW